MLPESEYFAATMIAEKPIRADKTEPAVKSDTLIFFTIFYSRYFCTSLRSLQLCSRCHIRNQLEGRNLVVWFPNISLIAGRSRNFSYLQYTPSCFLNKLRKAEYRLILDNYRTAPVL